MTKYTLCLFHPANFVNRDILVKKNLNIWILWVIFYTVLIKDVLGLHGKVLTVGEATGVACVRSCQKFPLRLTETMPAGSSTDPLLPISSNASGLWDSTVKKGEKHPHETAAGRGVSQGHPSPNTVPRSCLEFSCSPSCLTWRFITTVCHKEYAEQGSHGS